MLKTWTSLLMEVMMPSMDKVIARIHKEVDRLQNRAAEYIKYGDYNMAAAASNKARGLLKAVEIIEETL